MSGHYPSPNRKDHRTFCITELWSEVRNARGRTSHHLTFELSLPDGRVLRTRISHPPGRKTYGDSMWGHILRDQLEVTQEEFWRCVKDGILPDRGRAVAPENSVPAGVVGQLLAHGVPENEIRGMSREQAIARLNDIWSQ
ncbi:cytotoxic translational repressor of toxin-antitoxin stability system [Corynebacterium sp. AOP40-9SA-29]|uniref:cytotoxic translational repressor of toxin-antitoxin stability system n=1 Tax=Corynebacterium sp. AOP40-9SA-29 TaxID=3457677 RepID=UPI004033C2B3